MKIDDEKLSVERRLGKGTLVPAVIERGSKPGSRILQTQSGAVYEIDGKGTRTRRPDLEPEPVRICRRCGEPRDEKHVPSPNLCEREGKKDGR